MSDDLQISPEAMAAAYAAFSQSAPDRNTIAKAIYDAFHSVPSGKTTDPASEYALKAARAADAAIKLVAASFRQAAAIIQLSAENAELRRKLEAAEVFETMFKSHRDELLQSATPSHGMSRALMGKIVDEVFDGAIEDTKVIEDIYAAIKRHEAMPQAYALVKQAFLDGLNYATTCNVTNPEEAWRTSSARARLTHEGAPAPQTQLEQKILAAVRPFIGRLADDAMRDELWQALLKVGNAEQPQVPTPQTQLSGLDDATKQKLREALRFSASRSVMSAEDERRILSALETTAPQPNVDVEDVREQKLATIVAPDNGTPDEVLAAVLECARAWVPEARIIGNVRAGDIARAIQSLPAPKTHLAGPTAEQERIRFEGDLDKWMKIIGAGVTGYQPEAYAVMDLACQELVKLRSEHAVATAMLAEAQTVLLPFARDAEAIHSGWANERRRASLTLSEEVTVGHMRAAKALLNKISALATEGKA